MSWLGQNGHVEFDINIIEINMNTDVWVGMVLQNNTIFSLSFVLNLVKM